MTTFMENRIDNGVSSDSTHHLLPKNGAREEKRRPRIVYATRKLLSLRKLYCTTHI